MSTSMGNVAILVAMIVLSPMLPEIIETLAITPFEAGVALSVMWGAAALFQYPGGLASDDLSRKTVLVAALATLSVGSLVLAGTTAYALFLVGTAGLGVAAGLYWPTMFALTADLFDRRRGQAFGIIAGAGDVGGLVATGLAAVILASGQWRLAFVPIAALGGVVLASMHWWNHEPYVVDRVDIEARTTLQHLLATRELRLSLVAFSLFLFVNQGAVSFIPTLLQAEKGFSSGLANNAFAVLWVGGIVIKPAAGRLSDRLGNASVGAAAAVAAAVGLGVVLAGPSNWLVFVGLSSFAVGIGALWPTMIAYAMARFPDASMGGDLGGFRTASYAVGSVGPTYVGFVAERLSYETAFAGFAVCLVAVGGILLWLSLRP